MNAQHTAWISEIYAVLYPFTHCASNFNRTRTKEAFNKNSFFDKDPLTRATALYKIHQDEASLVAFQEAVSLNPNNCAAQLRLGIVEGNANNPAKYLERCQIVLANLQKRWELKLPM